MSSLYLHIPFCHHKCIYCAFYSVAQSIDKNLYIECLVNELQKRKNFIPKTLKTIYFGGGTPSLLSLEQIEKILISIENAFDISRVEEVTFEINSENADKDYLKGLKCLGINRLSIGVESFDDEDLRHLNRSHTSIQSKIAIENSINIGYDNISVDLISNLPFSSFNKWKKNLDIFLSYNIPHISCYTLMIEENTMLEKLIKKGKYITVSEESALKEFDYTMEVLEKNNYIHYETSSYSKQGFQSKHNMAYWTFQPYLGLGAAAHSYNGNVRIWNKEDVITYMNYYAPHKNTIQQNSVLHITEEETLSLNDKFEEYIMLSARMLNGLNYEYVKKHFPTYYDKFVYQCKKMMQQGYLNEDLSLTRKGWHLQDYLILNLCNI